MFSSATPPPPPPPPPPCHNFVSAITFEGFKLRSSNLTHILLIQISRTSSIIDIVVPSKMAARHFVKKKEEKKSKIKINKKFRMDLKWPEMTSKVNFGHPKWPINLKWPEMRSKMNFGHPKWPPAAIFPKKIKLHIDLKWAEMRSKKNFGHPKWPTSAILSKISKNIKVAYR